MSDYIEYNLAAFNAAQVVFTIADQYCVRIERQLAEIEKQFQENNRSNHTFQDGQNLVKNNKAMDNFIWPKNR